MNPRSPLHKLNWLFLMVVVLMVLGYFGHLWPSDMVYRASTREPINYKPNRVKHIATPEPAKAVYMTSYVAGVKSWRGKILKLIDDTELNSLVIDIKDYTGVSVGERTPDIKDFIKELHEHDVYVIGRVSVFQDQKYVKEHPELAVLRKDNGNVWRDGKGIAWLDPGSLDVWDYIVGIARDYYEMGFDEINFDYIRFPSDGDMNNISYTFASSTRSKSNQMKLFYEYLDHELRMKGIPISADLFGMTTSNTDDLGIGQVLENALEHFDYVAPMVYPSHYPPHFNGWPDPNKVPGEVVNYALVKAVTRALVASSSPDKIRPWLQDFDYGGNYGEKEVRAQINAVYDAGLTSWMLWDPGVKYTPGALDKIATPT
ncbi:MAG TPA: putative glycoside hydrolase [Candidatus Paceibacterota bacterium]